MLIDGICSGFANRMKVPKMVHVNRLIRRNVSRKLRAAFTVIELIVVIGILTLLVALILPAVQQARTSSRRAQCKNNLRNVSLGLIAETENKQHFPASGYFATTAGDYHNWVVTILPWIDQSTIYDKWDFQKPFNTPANFDLGNTPIQVLTCPDDTTVMGKGDLSFVVNGGFGWTGPPCGVITPSNYSPIDLNGSGFCTSNPTDGTPSDTLMMYYTGVMFCENWPTPNVPPRRHSLGTIRDGASQTILLAENVHAGFDPAGNHGNWANPNSWRTCFFISGHVCQGFACTSTTVDFKKANDHTQAPFLFESLNPPFQAKGAAPWPTSFHTGRLHFAFCDGSVRFLSENLDGAVYFSLVTPQGSSLEGPLAQPPLSNDF